MKKNGCFSTIIVVIFIAWVMDKCDKKSDSTNISTLQETFTTNTQEEINEPTSSSNPIKGSFSIDGIIIEGSLRKVVSQLREKCFERIFNSSYKGDYVLAGRYNDDICVLTIDSCKGQYRGEVGKLIIGFLDSKESAYYSSNMQQELESRYGKAPFHNSQTVEGGGQMVTREWYFTKGTIMTMGGNVKVAVLLYQTKHWEKENGY